MAKGYLLRADSDELVEREFTDAFDIVKAIHADFPSVVYPKFALSPDESRSMDRMQIWIDDMGIPKGLEPNLDLGNQSLYGDVVLLGKKMTPEGMDISDLDYKDAEIMLSKLQHNPAREYKWKQDAALEAKMQEDGIPYSKDVIVTGVAVEVDAKFVDDLMDANEFLFSLGPVRPYADSERIDNLLGTYKVGSDYVHNGLILPAGCDSVDYSNSEDNCYIEGTFEFDGVPGRFNNCCTMYSDDNNIGLRDGETDEVFKYYLDAYKYQKLMNEEFGIPLKLRIVEYGSLNEDKTINILHSEVRPGMVKTQEDNFELDDSAPVRSHDHTKSR